MSRFGRSLIILLVAVAMAACDSQPEESSQVAQSPRGSGPSGETLVTGEVRDANGAPVAGALVKVRGENAGLSYMVVTRAGGRYATPKLVPDTYSVQAFGGSYQSDSDPVTVVEDQQVNADLVLDTARVIPTPAKTLAYADYLEMMPEGGAKGFIASRCVMCHGLDRVVPARKSPQTWQLTVDRMAYYLADRPELGGPLSPEEMQVIQDYLSENFTLDTPRITMSEGPSDPNRHLPTELLEGVDARFVAMEFDPKTPVRNTETEFGIGPDGDAWISEGNTSIFGRFDPDTLTYTRFEPPPAKNPRSLAQISVDPEGLVWVLDNGSEPNAELISFNPESKEFKTYYIKAPLRYRSPLNTITFLNGNVWGTGNASSRVVKLDPDTGEVTAYPVIRGGHPFGLTIGPDEAVWYITNYNHEIIRLDPETGEQMPYEPPTKKPGLRRMGADAVGNIWAAAHDTNKLVKVDISTGEVTEYDIPVDGGAPYSVDVDTTGNLVWVSLSDAGMLARFDPHTETFVEYPLPVAGIGAQRILVDPVNARRVWWQCATGCIGYLETLQ